MEYLMPIDFTSILEEADDLDAPTRSEMHSATTRDVSMDDVVVDEQEAKIYKEKLEVKEDTIYGDLRYLEETIVQSFIQTQLIKMFMASLSGATSAYVTRGTGFQDQSATSDIDALTYGATVQTGPFFTSIFVIFINFYYLFHLKTTAFFVCGGVRYFHAYFL